MLGEGLDRLVAEGGVGEVVVDHVGRVGPGLRQGALALFAVLDDQPQRVRAAADRLDQVHGGDVPQVARHRLGLVGPEQLVHVIGVDPEQDQALVERQRGPEGVEDRAVQADQGEAVEPLEPERLEGQGAVVVERPQGRAEVGRAPLQADEVEDRQRVGQVLRVARPALDQLGHAARVGQDQGQGVGVPRRDAALGRPEPSDLGDQDAPVGVVGPLQPEVLAPVEQQVGRRVVGQAVAESPEVLGVLLVQVNRFEVEPVQQGEPAEAVGPLDRDGRLAVRFEGPPHQRPVARVGVAREQLGLGIGRVRTA